ncbi:uncharacterized protein IUM83_00947 [Phytophthora cinnamomi]|uniref:uncharacterized protein n=1 Tax=Phytophthora cinnamomi TaxID=4785 RepID=UPI003559B714|nr:hypothetical protein IUM83_00947 [Phytophthora cinnamomi]
MATASANLLAERRRLRKLENQRLEDAARQRQEELRRQQEDERKRLEDERVAKEQRRLQEREEVRRKKAAEEERIANLENDERLVIAGIEKQLKLVGAFWKSTMQLPSRGDAEALPMCVAVLTVRALEKPILGLDDDVILIGDNNARIHGFDRKTKKLLFTSSWGNEVDESLALRTPLAMASTRCGRLLGVRAHRSRNSRLAVFAKRGAVVQTIGRKGMHGGEFYDLRDVKLANVRKRAITRGMQPDSDTGISNEQFEAIVADCVCKPTS